MSKPSAVPFTFNTSFDTSEPFASKRTQKCTLTLAEIEDRERKAFEAGAASTQESQLVLLTRATDQLMNNVAALEGQIRADLGRAYAEASALSYVIATKLARVTLSKYPQAEIEALIAKCLEEQKGEAAIVLRVNDALLEPVREAAARLKSAQGFEGRLAIIGEPEIQTGDCRIEWADGGLHRELNRALKEIEGVVKGYVRAETDQTEDDLFERIALEPTTSNPGEGE